MNPEGIGGFRPGQSGNPGGRPRVLADVRDLARQHSPAAIAELARLSLRAKSEAVRVAAARELLDRAFGKAPTPPVYFELPQLDPPFTRQSGAADPDDEISF